MEIEAISSAIHLALLLVLLVVLIIFGYFSWTLTHHWNMYGFHADTKKIVLGSYFSVSIGVILLLVLFIGLYFLRYGF